MLPMSVPSASPFQLERTLHAFERLRNLPRRGQSSLMPNLSTLCRRPLASSSQPVPTVTAAAVYVHASTTRNLRNPRSVHKVVTASESGVSSLSTWTGSRGSPASIQAVVPVAVSVPSSDTPAITLAPQDKPSKVHLRSRLLPPQRQNFRRSIEARRVQHQAILSPGSVGGAVRDPSITSHPLQVLQHPGKDPFNTAPLTTILPLLVLQRAQPVVSSALAPQSQPCAVHAADVEGRHFRVDVNILWRGPLDSLLQAYPGCPHDGRTFYLTPLLDEGTAAEPAVEPAAPFHHTGGLDLFTENAVSTPRWRRYSTAVTLYLALAEAGFCDGKTLPFIAVQLVRWGDLLNGVETRLKLMRGGDRVRRALSERLRTPDELVPVGVTLPHVRKGVLRYPPGQTGEDETPAIVSQPFLDAELFQLFYLQLIFRAVFDVRLPALAAGVTCGGKDSSLRTDTLATTVSDSQGLAFQHPTFADRWLLFPPRSRVLTLLGMEDAVIPFYASETQLRATDTLPLAGGPADMSYLTPFGHAVAQWASQQSITGPHAATTALRELFELFVPLYGTTRAAVWQSPTAPRIFRCSEGGSSIVGLRDRFRHLIRFEVSAERWCCAETSLHSRGLAHLPRAGSVHSSMTDRLLDDDGAAKGGDTHCSFTSSLSVLPSRRSSRSLRLPHEGNDHLVLATETVGSSDGLVIRPNSPFSKKETLVNRWRRYTQDGNIAIFDGTMDDVTVANLLGRGGSGFVYRGSYGVHRLPVAVKVFIVPEGIDFEDYVRGSLTDVAFFVLCNQLDDVGVCTSCCAYDFIVSDGVPTGQPDEDVALLRRNGVATTKLCFLITDVMDGTLGRFLAEDEEGYDPCYGTLVNSPLRDGEIFQFLFVQLIYKAMFDWKVLDIILHGQLRGDNIGYLYVSQPSSGKKISEADGRCSSPSGAPLVERRYYEGIVISYQLSPDAPLRYLRFPANAEAANPSADPLRFIYFIDFGQGMQPNVRELTEKNYIGETVLDSCVQDDGFGRYWPMEELYCRNVEVKGDLATKVVAWGSQLRLFTQEDANQALADLLNFYYQTYGVEEPSAAVLASHRVFTWTLAIAAELRRTYVYGA